MKRLNQLKIGESGLVEKVEGSGRLRRRLLDMGITRGCQICLKKKAPLGDPLQVSLRGYELSLRKEEAFLVILKED